MKNSPSQFQKKRFGQESKYVASIAFIVIIIFAGITVYIRHWQKHNKTDDSVIIRIYPQNEQQVKKLRSLRFIDKKLETTDFLEIEGHFRDVLELNNRGIPAAIVIETELRDSVAAFYPSYQEMLTELTQLAESHPQILQLIEIGKTQFRKKSIYAAKISQFVGQKEDEPSVLFMAGLHAREAVGVQVCLEIVRYVVKNRDDPQVKNWLANLAIWVVPCTNPDGYDYVISNKLKFPWWRKNLRDNNHNGSFEPEIDGVDLNRNFDFNWRTGGSDDSTTWYYRGKRPHSENEVQAIANLAEQEKFVLAVDFHSFGESVLYPWSNEMKPPDFNLIADVAQQFANKLDKFGRHKKYRTIPLNGKSGQSANWLYSKYRTIAFIVEVGPEYFPARNQSETIVHDQLAGVKFLLNRVQLGGISGLVLDEINSKPVEAIVQLEFDFSPKVEPTRSDEKFGRFRRLLLPGKYRLSVSADGYQEKQIAPVLVDDRQMQRVKIKLKRAKIDG